MSISSEITRLENAKAAIAAAIAEKGVTVPDGTLLDGMAALIEGIQAGGGGLIVEAYSIIPASNISALYEVGTTTITMPHACFCIDGTTQTSGDSGKDSTLYTGFMAYAGMDSHFFGEIGSPYAPSNFATLYNKGPTNLTYARYVYGASIGFNSFIGNSFYVKNGKLYCDPTKSRLTAWNFEAGRPYYVILIGE